MTKSRTLSYHVQGMDCGHCVAIVASAVRELPGVRTATVDRSSGTVRVRGSIDDVSVRRAIVRAGYTVQV